MLLVAPLHIYIYYLLSSYLATYLSITHLVCTLGWALFQVPYNYELI